MVWYEACDCGGIYQPYTLVAIVHLLLTSLTSLCSIVHSGIRSFRIHGLMALHTVFDD